MCLTFAASVNAGLSLAVIGGATVYKALVEHVLLQKPLRIFGNMP